RTLPRTRVPYTTLFRSDPLEGGAGRRGNAVEGGQLRVHERERRGQQRRHLAVAVPDDRVDQIVDLGLHQAAQIVLPGRVDRPVLDRKSTRLNSSHGSIS